MLGADLVELFLREAAAFVGNIVTKSLRDGGALLIEVSSAQDRDNATTSETNVVAHAVFDIVCLQTTGFATQLQGEIEHHTDTCCTKRLKGS